jgi:thiamine biosynthesis lipoprotein
MMVAVLLFVLELRDRLVFADFLRPLARAVQIRFTRVLGADRDLRQQLRQIAASAFGARGGRIARAHERFEFMSALSALVFVERHKTLSGRNYHRQAAVFTLLMGSLIGITACRQAAPEVRASEGEIVERARLSMGSELRLTAWATSEKTAVEAFEAVFSEFDRLEALMSVWKPGSDVVRLNEAAGLHPVPVSPEVIEVLEDARQVSEWTGGKFDVTFGALSGLWKFDHDQDNRVPSPRDVAAKLPLVDYRALEINRTAGTAYLTKPGMRAHLGGIGKGYAIDRGAAILRARGFRDFMIQAGGDLYVAGRRGDRPWRVAIRDPRGPEDRSFAALDLTDGTFSTSGDYERFFIDHGRRYHHILDPDLGEPARASRSVTIVATRAVVADGLSTGVFIIGGRAGMDLIERLPEVEGVIVTNTNEVLVSSGLQGRLQLLAKPTDAP